jgi:hypothetical protein
VEDVVVEEVEEEEVEEEEERGMDSRHSAALPRLTHRLQGMPRSHAAWAALQATQARRLFLRAAAGCACVTGACRCTCPGSGGCRGWCRSMPCHTISMKMEPNLRFDQISLPPPRLSVLSFLVALRSSL